MNSQSHMLLTSHGYLNEVVEENNQTIARICKIQTCESAKGESAAIIWLDCVIDNEDLKKRLRTYQDALVKGHAVIVKFAAKYLAITGYQAGIAEDATNNMITMKTQLADIMEIYKDGVQHYPVINSLWKFTKMVCNTIQ